MVSRIAASVRQHGRAADYLEVRGLREIRQNLVLNSIGDKARLVDARTDNHLSPKTYDRLAAGKWQVGNLRSANPYVR